MLSSPKTKRSLRFALLSIPAAILALFWNSCTPEYGMSTEDYDIVATYYDNSFDYGAVRTFAMPDSVIHIVDTSRVDDIGRDYDALILNEVVRNLESRGYTRETDPESNGSDVVVLVYATSADNYYTYPWSPWWGYWGRWPGWGYWPPGPGWGPRYPRFWRVGSYRTGTLVIDMLDPNDADTDAQLIPSRWVALQNGLLNDVNSGERIANNIAQAFNQSPYLGAKP